LFDLLPISTTPLICLRLGAVVEIGNKSVPLEFFTIYKSEV
jgi:hypothetical protein